MKKIVLILLAVMFMFVGGLEWPDDVQAVEIGGMNLTGEARILYPIETDTNANDVFSVSLLPDYVFDGKANLQINDSWATYFELDVTENTVTTYAVGTSYFYNGGPVGVTLKALKNDMKRNRHDNTGVMGGFVARLK